GGHSRVRSSRGPEARGTAARLRWVRRAGAQGLRGAGRGCGDREGRQGGLRERLRRPAPGRSHAGGRPDPVPHRGPREAVPGELIGAVAAAVRGAYVHTPILARGGLTHRDVHHAAAGRAGNVAPPHAEVSDTVRPVAPFLSDNTNPAGGIVSGAEDIAKWLI